MMIFYSITVSIIIEEIKIVYILINTGYLVYKTISFMFIRKANFEYISIPARKLIGIGGKKGRIDEIVKVEIDIDKYKQDVYFYIIQNYLEYNLILEKPWMEYHDIKIILKTNIFFIYLLRIRIRSNKVKKKRLLKFLEIGVTVY